MTEDVVVKCKLLVQNRDVLKNEFQWASTNMIPFCAYYSARCGKRVDAVRMKECKQVMKRSAGVFTKVKGDDVYPFAAMLALEKNVNKALKERINLYQTLKMSYEPSIWLTMAAFLLAETQNEKETEIKELVARAAILENSVKGQRTVTEEERILYLLLASSEKEEKLLAANLKAYYEEIETLNLNEDAKVVLTAILALGNGSPEETVHKLEVLVQELENRQLKIGKGIECAALGLVAVSEGEVASYIEEIAEINEYLKQQKGFASIYLAANERLMYAALLATADKTSALVRQITRGAMLESIMSLTVLE